MVVGVLVVQFNIPGSQSLKDKRQVVRRIKDRIQNRHNVSLSETGGQTTWQFCEIAVAMVAANKTAVERELNRIVEFIESEPEVAALDFQIDYV